MPLATDELLHHLQVTTYLPSKYVLLNTEDGSAWRGNATGWIRDGAPVSSPVIALRKALEGGLSHTDATRCPTATHPARRNPDCMVCQAMQVLAGSAPAPVDDEAPTPLDAVENSSASSQVTAAAPERPGNFSAGETWTSPKGVVYRVMSRHHDEVELRRGADASGRSTVRRRDDVEGWTLVSAAGVERNSQ